jgi:hypothetical protein
LTALFYLSLDHEKEHPQLDSQANRPLELMALDKRKRMSTSELTGFGAWFQLRGANSTVSSTTKPVLGIANCLAAKAQIMREASGPFGSL